jgi:hypothetical protein
MRVGPAGGAILLGEAGTEVSLTGDTMTGGGTLDGFGFTVGSAEVVSGWAVGGGIGEVAVGPLTATGDVGGGGGGGFPPFEVGCAGTLLGVVRPGWIVKARGGSKTPNKFVAQVAQRGSSRVTPGGIENCGVQSSVRYWC